METTWRSPHAAELQARAAEVRDDAVPERQALERGRDAEPRLVSRAQDLHLDALVAPQRAEQPLAVARRPAPPRSRRRGRAGPGRSASGARRSGARPGAWRRSPRAAGCRARRRPSRVGTRSSASTWKPEPGRCGEQEADGRRARDRRPPPAGRFEIPAGAGALWGHASGRRERRSTRLVIGGAGETYRLQEPAELAEAGRPVGQVHEGGAALLEREPLAVRGAEQASRERRERGLVADDRRPVASGGCC